jgi:hypothetical protein
VVDARRSSRKIKGTSAAGSVAVRRALLGNPVFRRRVVRFVACLRQSGIKVPIPDVGNGFVLDTNTVSSSPRFKTAEAKCRSYVSGGFHLPKAGEPQGSTQSR